MKKQGKKILVGGLAIILVGGIIASIVYFKQVNKYKEDLENYVEEEKIEDIGENEINTTIEDNLTEEEIQEDILEENDNNTSISNVETTSPNTQNTKETQNIDNNKQNTSKQSSNTKTENKQEVSQPVATTVVEEPKKEETKPVETPKQDVHTYKYNSAIVEKIRQDIVNNESEYMKQYGYTIIVDESIVTQTNQFTYTGNRVKDMIVYKFGTIRIYARDYYLNGNYMYTECYII